MDYHRRSIRLRGYDYAQIGYYFVTVCVQHRDCLLGEIINGRIKLNPIGKMVNLWWGETMNKFTPERQYDFVIMPNHIHGIVVINGVGADRCVCPNNTIELTNSHEGAHIGAPLPHIIRWFKTMTTNEYLKNISIMKWPNIDKRLWQRNYYEHIIRNEKDYWAIKQYMENNPKNWEKDELFIS